MDVGRSIFSRQAEEKGHQVRAMGVLSAVEHIFNETAMQARTPASNRLAKANRASHGPRVKAKERVTRTMEDPKDSPQKPKVPKGHARVKHRKLVSQVLKNLKSETRSETQESAQLGDVCATGTSWIGYEWSPYEWNDGWSLDEWNDDWSSVGWHEGWEQTNNTSARSFSLGSLDFGATSSAKLCEWVKMNLDTGAAANPFPWNFGPEGAGDGRFYRTATGDWIPEGGAWQYRGYDENGLLRSLNGRLTDAHQVLCSAAEIACKGQQDFYLGHNGGYMIPIHSKIGQGMRIHFEKLVNGYGKNDLIPVYLETNIFNFYLNRGVKSTETNNVNKCFAVGKRGWQSSALVSPTTTLNRNVAPMGDDIEPAGESRADVETGNEEEESSEGESPKVEMKPKNSMSREEQKHEDYGHAVYRSWCAACVEGRGVGRHLQVEPLEEEERERTTPCWLLIAVSLHKSMQTHFQF